MLKLADVVAAKNSKDGKFYRARLINMGVDNNVDLFTVFFMDIGTTEICKLEDLRQFRDRVPQATNLPRCFECRLAQIEPSQICSKTGMWSETGNKLFADAIKRTNGNVTAEVWFSFFGLHKCKNRI